MVESDVKHHKPNPKKPILTHYISSCSQL